MSGLHWNALQTTVHGVIGLDFDKRSSENQAAMVVREAAHRLRGMSNLLYGMALSHKQAGGHNSEKISFIGAVTDDLALSLERAHAALSLAAEDLENEREHLRKKAKKRGKKA
jgi:K+-sensing histidine kinase KdpD